MGARIYHDDVIDWLQMNEDGQKFHGLISDPPYNLDTISKRFGKEGSAEAKYGEDGSFKRLSSGFLGAGWDTDIAMDPDTWRLIRSIMLPGSLCMAFSHARTYHRMAMAIEEAGFIIYPMIGWITGQGFPHPTKSPYYGYYHNRNALKGALEPIVVFQTPYEGTMSDNFSTYGTGGWNIEGARIQGDPVPINVLDKWSGFGEQVRPSYKATVNDKGRWPSNIIIAEDFELPFDRFFYQSKPTRKEKDAGLEGKNPHPTIKPIDLIKHLATLILPPRQFSPRKLFVPFAGTGSEIIGATQAGWDLVEGVEVEEEIYETAVKRIEYYVEE